MDRKARNGVNSFGVKFPKPYVSLVVPLVIRCRANPKEISQEGKEKYKASPARKAWLEERKQEGKDREKRTNFGAISGFTAQGVLSEDEYPVFRIVVEEDRCLNAAMVL